MNTCDSSTISRIGSHLFAAWKLLGAVHLCAGEEDIAVGACALPTEKDHTVSTHRGHGRCIAKGMEINAMMAEPHAKASWTCKGKGGSMHIADVDKGVSVPPASLVRRRPDGQS